MNAKQAPHTDTPTPSAEATPAPAPTPVEKPKTVRSPHTRERDPAKRKQWKRERAKALGDLPNQT